MVAIFIFTLGTLLCAPIAHNFTVFLVGRSIQGIGGGGVITLGQVIYADIVPLRQRPKYFSIVLGTWAVGSVIGPLLGGAFVDRLSWRWCFYINVWTSLFHHWIDYADETSFHFVLLDSSSFRFS